MCEYMMRNLLSIAITQIAKKTFANESVISGDVCPSDEDLFPDDEDDVINEGIYEWSEALQGVILSSFYWGYIVTHIPGGMLVERFGGKITALGGIAATSLLTLLTPVSISLGGSTLLIVNRIVMGLCQGFIYASVFGLLSTWIPLRERTTLGVFVLSGIQVNDMGRRFYRMITDLCFFHFKFGSVLSTYLSGLLIHNLNGWEWPFYIYSAIGVVWCIAFVSY